MADLVTKQLTLLKTMDLEEDVPYIVIAMRKVTMAELGDKVIFDLLHPELSGSAFSYFLPNKYSMAMIKDPKFAIYRRKCPPMTMTYKGKKFDGHMERQF